MRNTKSRIKEETFQWLQDNENKCEVFNFHSSMVGLSMPVFEAKTC